MCGTDVIFLEHERMDVSVRDARELNIRLYSYSFHTF